MLRDPRIEKWADVIVRYCLELKAGQWLLLQGNPLAYPLIEAIYRATLKIGARPDLRIGFPELEEIYLREAPDETLDWVSPSMKYEIEHVDARFVILTTHNTKNLSGADPTKQQRQARARGAILQTMLERAAKKEMRWSLTLYPHPAAAQDAEMGSEEYAEFVFDACLLNTPDPVAEWRKVEANQEKWVEFLNQAKEVHFKADGTDLRLKVAERTWINCCGHENFPDGEIFTGPIEDQVEGVVRFTYPAVQHGREIEGIELHFEKGVVVKAKATKNEAYLQKLLEADEGARHVGEIAIGTNPRIQRFTKNILFDEKIGGTFHLAIGAAYPETGATNKSAIHVDMICNLREGGQIFADGKLFYKDGKFLI
jgi:aminopeptidase